MPVAFENVTVSLMTLGGVGALILALLRYLWGEHARTVQERIDAVKDQLKDKADVLTMDRLRHDIDKLEMRQREEVEGLRSDINNLSSALRNEFKERTDLIIEMLRQMSK